MRAGRLREIITIRNRSISGTQSSFGEWETSVSTLATGVWCRVRTITADEVFLDQERKLRTVKEFTIRYRGSVSETGSIVHDGSTYDIKSIENPDERDRMLVIIGEKVT